MTGTGAAVLAVFMLNGCHERGREGLRIAGHSLLPFRVVTFETLQSFSQFSVLIDEGVDSRFDTVIFVNVLFKFIDPGGYRVISILNARI